MVLDERIKLLGDSDFRPQLSSQDVKKGYGLEVDVFSSNESMSNHGIEYSEKALLFLDKPICVPNTSYLFQRRLYSIKDDKKIERVVKDLMFINPNINEYGIKNMTSWIVNFYVYTNDAGKKRITHEQLLPKVSYYCEKYKGGDVDIIESSKVVLYKKDSLLTPEDKRWYSNHFRNKTVSKMLGDAIHEAAILAAETEHEYLKLTYAILLDHTDKIKDIKTIKRNVEERTVRFFEDENKVRCIETRTTAEKFNSFKEVYDNNYPLDFYTKELNISKTTAVGFKKLITKIKR